LILEVDRIMSPESAGNHGPSGLMSHPRRPESPKRDEVTREWRKLHNEEFYVMYCPPNILRVIKSRRMRWRGM
jgi:hypothetical protein